MVGGLEQAAGLFVIALVLGDVFMTVLYARARTGVLSGRLFGLIWRGFRLAQAIAGRHDKVVLSYCGPVILLSLLAFWAIALAVGAALVIHPALGEGVTTSSGETPTDVVSAFYAGANSLAIVGSSDFSPQTGGFRLFYLCMSLVGLAVLSLTLTYLGQVYTALQARNVLGLNLQLATRREGDAAELLAALGPGGRFDQGYSDIGSLASGMTDVKEAHHFYPVLFYFRFRDSRYAVSRTTLVALDMVTLIESALDDDQFGWLRASAAVTHLQRASLALVETLADVFLPDGVPDLAVEPDADDLERWRQRYRAAIARLREAGIATRADEEGGAEEYLRLRARWDPYVEALAPAMSTGSTRWTPRPTRSPVRGPEHRPEMFGRGSHDRRDPRRALRVSRRQAPGAASRADTAAGDHGRPYSDRRATVFRWYPDLLQQPGAFYAAADDATRRRLLRACFSEI